MINIHNLNLERQNLEKRKTLVFKKILLRIHNKIKIANKLNNFCYYEIPSIVLGMPLFNLRKCSDYIYEQLISQGFKVTRVDYNKFMIYWGHVIENKSNEDNYSHSNNNNDNSNRNNQYRNINNITKNSSNFIYDI